MSMVSATICRMKSNIGKEVTLIRPHPSRWKSKYKKAPEVNERGIIKGAVLSRYGKNPVYTIYWKKSKTTWEKLESEVKLAGNHKFSPDDGSLVEPNPSRNSSEAHVHVEEEISNYKEKVYVAETNTPGYFYVGKSTNPDERIRQHNQGTGSEFCRAHGGVARRIQRLTPETDNACIDEQQELLAQMLRHGFNNVRGWEFTNTDNLTVAECESIKMLIIGGGDLCRKCGGKGHFSTECHHDKKRWLHQLEAIKKHNNENEPTPHTSKQVLQQLAS